TVNEFRSSIGADGAQHEIVIVANRAVSAIAVHDEPHDVRPGGQPNIVYGESSPGLPAAAVGIGQRPGFVDAIEFDMKSVAMAAGGDAELKSVKTIDQCFDTVSQPFAGRGPADIVTAARI